MAGLTYKKSGVDIKKSDEFIKEMKQIFAKSKINKLSAFGSLFDVQSIVKKIKKPVLVSSTDGVGTKLILAQELNIHNTVGQDLVAMNVNDIICLGARPLFFLDYIACGKLKPGVLLKVARSIKQGLKESECALLGGETAEMPGMYGKNEYDLAGFCVGVVDKRKVIDGTRIKPGDAIIGLSSSGLHSNGFSLARKALTKKEIKKYSKQLLAPTRIYVKPILSLLSSKKLLPSIKGIAHITGGAFSTKATKILPKGLGMVVNKKSWSVPKIFSIIQRKGKISDKEMYSVFNMGIGMILVVSKKDAKKIKSILGKKCEVNLIGEITRSSEQMNLL